MEKRSRHFAALCLGLSLWTVALNGSAQEPGTDAGSPTLVVLSAGDDFRGVHLFAEELRLAFDSFRVRVESLERDEFAALPLAAKLEAIRPVATRLDAAAVIWLGSGGDGEWLLNLAALDAGRVSVKIARAGPGAGAYSELALVAVELLGEVYLFDAQRREPPLQAIVQQRYDDLTSGPEPAAEIPTPEPHPRWAVPVAFSAEGGLRDTTGPTVRFGGSLGLEFRLIHGLLLRPGVAAHGGPFGSLERGALRGWDIQAALDLAYLFDAGVVRVGPVLGLFGERRSLIVDLAGVAPQIFAAWSGGARLGLSLRLAVARRFEIAVEPLLAVNGNNLELNYMDGAAGVGTARFDWLITAGLIAWGGR